MLFQKLMGGAYSIVASSFGYIDNSSTNEVTSLSSEKTKPMTQFIKQFRAELSKMNQFNDPQGIYTLCLTCTAQ